MPIKHILIFRLQQLWSALWWCIR